MFRSIDNNRGRAMEMRTGFPEPQIPIYPSFESFSKTYRSQNTAGSAPDVRGDSGLGFLAMKVEEPRGSGRFPKREFRTIGVRQIQVISVVGICESAKGVCR